MVIDTGPFLLGMLLIGSILISSVLHLFIKNHLAVGVATAVVTVAAVITIVSISVGFFEKGMLLGVGPGLIISLLISYLVLGALRLTRKNQI